jgi:hypothetical protein
MDDSGNGLTLMDCQGPEIGIVRQHKSVHLMRLTQDVSVFISIPAFFTSSHHINPLRSQKLNDGNCDVYVSDKRG